MSNEIKHYGVKGMKWGVRKDKNSAKKEKGYSIDKDGRITIDKGHLLQRVYQSGKQSDGSQGANYFSFTKEDNHIYIMMMGAGATSKFSLFRKLAADTISKSVATETLKSPSRKEAFDILNETIVQMGPKAGVKPFKKDFSDKKALLWYQNQNTRIVLDKDTDLHKVYFKNLRSKGYNILLDETDSGFLSELPIVVLDGQKSLKQVTVKDIKREDLEASKKFTWERRHVPVREIEDFIREAHG